MTNVCNNVAHVIHPDRAGDFSGVKGPGAGRVFPRMKSETTAEAPAASSAPVSASIAPHLREISAAWRMSCLPGLSAAMGYVLCRLTVAGWVAYGHANGLTFLEETMRPGDCAVAASKNVPVRVLYRDDATGIFSWAEVSS